MALSREKKEQRLQEYAERLGRAQVMIWSSYLGLTVAGSTILRRQLRAAGAEVIVVKNTLMRAALEQAGLPLGENFMGGPRMVTFVYDEIAPAAKVLVSFARENDDIFQVEGGLIGGKLAGVEQIRSLTALPSRDALLAQVVGGIQAPISGLVGTLAAMIRGLVNVLNARSQQLESAES